MNTLQRNKRRQGFSLAEMMVVIVIIGLLVTMVVPNVMRKLGKATTTIAKQDIVSIDQALLEYATEHGMKYPDSLDQLIEPDANGDKYLDRESLPVDPWGMEYQYDPPTQGNNYRVYTFGKDGVPGGEGDDADMDQRSIREK